MDQRSAPRSWMFLPLLVLLPILLTVNGDGSTSTMPSSADLQVLQLVNDYRTTVPRIPALKKNDGAFCVGQQVVQTFVNTACTNSTGAFSPYGDDANIPNFQGMLTSCQIALMNVTAGYIAVDCVPEGVSSSSGPTVAAQNFTTTRKYGTKINDTSFASAGVGSDGIWYALILATDTPDGNYGVTPGLKDDSGTLGRALHIPVIWAPIVVLFSLWVRVQDPW